VYIVKFLMIGPVRFHVVNLETDVRWYPAWTMLSVHIWRTREFTVRVTEQLPSRLGIAVTDPDEKDEKD